MGKLSRDVLAEQLTATAGMTVRELAVLRGAVERITPKMIEREIQHLRVERTDAANDSKYCVLSVSFELIPLLPQKETDNRLSVVRLYDTSMRPAIKSGRIDGGRLLAWKLPIIDGIINEFGIHLATRGFKLSQVSRDALRYRMLEVG